MICPGPELCTHTGEPCCDARERVAKPTVRLSAAQTQAAKARVHERGQGWTYWTPTNMAPTYPTRREAEDASIQEWRDNL